MNTQLAAEEEVDEFDEFEPEGRSSGLSLRDGGTDLFRGVLVALIAFAVGALVLTQGYGGETSDAAGEDSSITSGELTAADPDATLTSGEADAASAEADPASAEADPEAPAVDDAMADDAMADDADGTDTGAADDGATTDQTTVDDSTTDTTSTTPTTTAAITDTARPAGEVQVVVLNATERKGIAGQGTELVEAAGYDMVPAGNATEAIGSVILYMEGYRADAIAVSQAFTDGLEGLVQPYDATSPPAVAEDIEDAKVIVILGIDDAIPIG